MTSSRVKSILAACLAGCVLSTAITGPLFAQAPFIPSGNEGPAQSADEEWSSIKGLGRPKPTSVGSSRDQAAVEAARQQAVEGLLADANKLRGFRSSHPTHPHVKEAKRLETLALLHAAAAGDVSQKERRETLVREIRGDSELTSRARSEVAAFADNLAVKQRKLERGPMLDALDQAVRALIVEFPDVPTGYESLLRIASAQSEESAVRVAREIQEMEAAPLTIRQEARLIIARAGLIGKGLHEVFDGLDTRGALPNTINRPIILYTWSSWSANSIARAKKISADAPPGVLLIGINMDEDEGVARAALKESKLKGEQVFDREKRGGVWAQALALPVPGMVVVTDNTGRISNVAAHRDLDVAFEAIGRR